jgi:uncharacterized damage-inducible protein DinB
MATKSGKKRASREAIGIADQLRRAFEGDAWHGPAVLELLKGVDAATAAAHPLPDVHSIWELVLHIAAWDSAALSRIGGKKAKLKGKQNFPPVPHPTASVWHDAVAQTVRTHDLLVKTVSELSESRLRDIVPGKRYDFYHMLHGVAQHELYHAGQIAILKKAAKSRS